MFDKIKLLGTDTAIYGISTILGRFLNFLLVPFYTNVLRPDDYGIVTYLYSLIAFVNVLYSYGMESAYFKYSSTLEIGTSKQNFSTPFFSLLGSSVVFSIFLWIFAGQLTDILHIPHATDSIILYAAGMVACDAIAIVPFASLRMERKSKVFAAIKFLSIFINVMMNIVLLVVLRVGIVGVFISGFVASLSTLIFLLPTIRRNVVPEFNTALWKSLLKFGLPFIPAGLATMVVQVIDRPILRALTDDATVGIYQANYRLGIFMMLIVSMYDYAWRPFYFSIAKEPDCKQIFARVLTYIVLLMSLIFLGLSLFIGDIVKIEIGGRYLIHPNYWSGLPIVPIVLLGYLFLGVSTNLSAGIYIEKKTYQLPITTFIGAAVNIAANYLLIPTMGMAGAAWATLAAYAIMALALYVMVQRVYPVRYEATRLSKIAIATAVVYALYAFIHPAFAWVYKLGLIVLFVALMYGMKFFEGNELRRIRELFSRPKRAQPDAGQDQQFI